MLNPHELDIHQKLEKQAPNLLGFLVMLTGNRHLADDLFQETSLEILKLTDKYDPNADFGAWARQIARYQVLRYWRKSHREKIAFWDEELIDQLEEAWLEEGASEVDYEEMYGKALNSCLDDLKDASRTVLGWRYRDSWSCEKIASEMERSVDAIKMLLCRLRKKLRQCVEKKID